MTSIAVLVFVIAVAAIVYLRNRSKDEPNGAPNGPGVNPEPRPPANAK